MDSTTAVRDGIMIRRLLIAVTVLFLTVFLILPIAVVIASAFAQGMSTYWAAITEPEAMDALRLTLTAAGVAVVCNTIFGLAAAWMITNYAFRGKNLLITLIDLPFTVSPVISGLIFVLLFGGRSVIGRWLIDHGFKIIFATPGIILATCFVTFPFVARELIPLMQSQGNQEEEAAYMLGANGWQLFWRVTVPKIKWGILYGVVLAAGRAVGEFGAVSVVSGHIRGVTNTLPLHIEILYNEYQFSAAFAVATILLVFAIVTLVLKRYLEYRIERKVTPS